jgi:hypothetical protein
MDFRFIDDGTRMDIQQMGAPDAPTYYGIFIEMEKGVSFLISCDPLYERFESLDPSIIYTFTFFRGATILTFDGKLVEQQTYLTKHTLLVTATTLVKTSSRRTTHRIKVQMSLNIYEKDDSQPFMLGTQVCTGLMHDVSRGGLTFLTNERIKLTLRKVYMSEFPIAHLTFRFPVEYVRGSERSLSPLYRYDHAFMYNNIENLTEDLNKMTLALFEQQLKGAAR